MKINTGERSVTNFYMKDQLYNGTLVYKGKVYKGVEMKYDIYDQQLILSIKNNNSIVLDCSP